MSYTSTYTINGYDIKFSDFGILLDPDGYSLDDPDFIVALARAYEVYDVINNTEWLGDFGSINDLTYASDDFFKDALQKIEVAETQTLFEIAPSIMAGIANIKAAYAGKRGKTKITPVPPSPKKGVVYLLQSGVFHKIGFTTRAVEDRVKEIQAQMPHEIRVLHTIPSDDIEALETTLHERYQWNRVNGEWFTLSQENVNEIKSLGGDA